MQCLHHKQMLVTPGAKAWPCGHLHPVPRGGGAGGAGQVVWVLMVVLPIMQEQCLNCGLGCLGRNNVLPLA